MEWFIGLPIAVQIISVILFIALLYGLAYIGKVNLKFGKNVISFGRIAKRSCGDCILLMMGKRERLDSQRSFILNRILKDQMNFAEQKLIDVQSLLLSTYRQMMFDNRTDESTPTEENKQYRLYQGILNTAQCAIKDEVRRSFKENGFEHLGGAEFVSYVRNKLSTLVSIGKDHVNNLYPYEGMIVSVEDRGRNLDHIMSKLEDISFELFSKAKDIKLEAKKKVEEIDKDFSKEIDEFVLMRPQWRQQK